MCGISLWWTPESSAEPELFRSSLFYFMIYCHQEAAGVKDGQFKYKWRRIMLFANNDPHHQRIVCDFWTCSVLGWVIRTEQGLELGARGKMNSLNKV